MKPKSEHIVAAVVTLIIVTVCLICWYAMPAWRTDRNLKLAVNQANARDLDSGKSSFVDGWGNPIRIVRENFKVEKYILYTAWSAGRDEKFDTDDDKFAFKKNRNWSGIIGRAAADKAKRFMEGWREGKEEESRHDKD